jgi:hypothetical protein
MLSRQQQQQQQQQLIKKQKEDKQVICCYGTFFSMLSIIKVKMPVDYENILQIIMLVRKERALTY